MAVPVHQVYAGEFVGHPVTPPAMPKKRPGGEVEAVAEVKAPASPIAVDDSAYGDTHNYDGFAG